MAGHNRCERHAEPSAFISERVHKSVQEMYNLRREHTLFPKILGENIQRQRQLVQLTQDRETGGI